MTKITNSLYDTRCETCLCRICKYSDNIICYDCEECGDGSGHCEECSMFERKEQE